MRYPGIDDPRDALAFGWVGGSIQGIELGAVVATLLGCAFFWAKTSVKVDA